MDEQETYEKYVEGLCREPKSAVLWRRFALFHLKNGNVRGAVQFYASVVSYEPDNMEYRREYDEIKGKLHVQSAGEKIQFQRQVENLTSAYATKPKAPLEKQPLPDSPVEVPKILK